MRLFSISPGVVAWVQLFVLLVMFGPSTKRCSALTTPPTTSSSHMQNPAFRYVAFYKPPLTLCTFRSDREVATRKHRPARSTLRDFPSLPAGLHAVGRLDRDSEGLLLLTDDGQFTRNVCDPSSSICPKVYWARVRGQADATALEAMRQGGLRIRGAVTRPPVSVDTLLDHPPQHKQIHAALPRAAPGMERPGGSWLQIILTEGRNRQVRKITAHAGLPTTRLVRVAIGSLRLFHNGSLCLQPGEWRYIRKENVLGKVEK